MTKDEQNSRIELARRRTLELHRKVGSLSTCFAGIELQLIETLSKCINPFDPRRAEIALSHLSFGQCINAFNQTVVKLYTKPEIIDQAKDIAKRLHNVSSRRNEIIHSSWIAYSTGDYGQHRARAKGNKAAGLHGHKDSPGKKVNELVDEIDTLVFNLICFEDELNKNKSK